MSTNWYLNLNFVIKFPQLQRSHVNHLCCTFFKYKIGPIIPSLVSFTRVSGGMRGSVCVKTIPETEVHPRSYDTYLLNELPCWPDKTHDYKPTWQLIDYTSSLHPFWQQRSVLWKIIFPENWGGRLGWVVVVVLG